jgi:hypothetical protein
METAVVLASWVALAVTKVGTNGDDVLRGTARPRACYEPTPRMPVACWRKRQAKATKCNPAKVAGSLS